MTAREVLWTPGPERVQNATLTAYTLWLERTRGLRLGSYEALWSWSTGEIAAFWASVDEYFALGLGVQTDTVLAPDPLSGVVWFPGASVNLAERILANRDPELTALQHASERRPLRSWSWGRLSEETARIRTGLRQLGVGAGDRVAAYLPNIPETVAAFLATASLGAIWSGAAPESEAEDVIDRFSQVAPTVLLGVDGYRHGGRDVDRSATVDAIVAQLPSRPRLIRLGYLADTGWEAELTGAADPLEFERVSCGHPLWILHDVDPHGSPRPIVHSHGGMLLELTKTAALHLNAQRGDNIFWLTSTGSMMWNVLVGVLLTEASIVLFDGNPAYPDLSRLWDLASAAEMTTFGTSAAYLTRCMEAEIAPAQGRDLSRLTALGTTGRALGAAGAHWVSERVGEDLWLFGTVADIDMCTALVGGVPTLPVRAGECQARALGAAVEAWGPDGRPIVSGPGELVLTRPMPSLPIGRWGDADRSPGRDGHLSTPEGVWRRGDRIELTPDGGVITAPGPSVDGG